jgi:hypothetical protein
MGFPLWISITSQISCEENKKQTKLVKYHRHLQKTYAVVATLKPQLRNRATSSSQPTNATFATDATIQPTFATDQRNRRNHISDKVQIIDWPCFLDSQIIRSLYYLKESRWKE